MHDGKIWIFSLSCSSLTKTNHQILQHLLLVKHSTTKSFNDYDWSTDEWDVVKTCMISNSTCPSYLMKRPSNITKKRLLPLLALGPWHSSRISSCCRRKDRCSNIFERPSAAFKQPQSHHNESTRYQHSRAVLVPAVLRQPFRLEN